MQQREYEWQVCMCVCVYTSVWVRERESARVHVWVGACIQAWVRKCVCMCVCVCVGACMCVHVRVCVCVLDREGSRVFATRVLVASVDGHACDSLQRLSNWFLWITFAALYMSHCFNNIQHDHWPSSSPLSLYPPRPRSPFHAKVHNGEDDSTMERMGHMQGRTISGIEELQNQRSPGHNARPSGQKVSATNHHVHNNTCTLSLSLSTLSPVCVCVCVCEWCVCVWWCVCVMLFPFPPRYTFLPSYLNACHSVNIPLTTPTPHPMTHLLTQLTLPATLVSSFPLPPPPPPLDPTTYLLHWSVNSISLPLPPPPPPPWPIS